MSIYYDRKKINKILEFSLILILIFALAYAVGIIALGFSKKSPVIVTYQENQPKNEVKTPEIEPKKPQIETLDEIVVVSKKGTKYHLLTCPGAKTIAAENKITFPNAKAAEKAGYAPAKNCKGLIPELE